MKKQHGRELDGAETAMMFDEFVNGADDSEFAAFAKQIVERTHRTLQQRIMALFMATIERWAECAESPLRYDARNEATVKLAAKMFAAAGDKYDRHLPLI